MVLILGKTDALEHELILAGGGFEIAVGLEADLENAFGRGLRNGDRGRTSQHAGKSVGNDREVSFPSAGVDQLYRNLQILIQFDLPGFSRIGLSQQSWCVLFSNHGEHGFQIETGTDPDAV